MKNPANRIDYILRVKALLQKKKPINKKKRVEKGCFDTYWSTSFKIKKNAETSIKQKIHFCNSERLKLQFMKKSRLTVYKKMGV